MGIRIPASPPTQFLTTALKSSPDPVVLMPRQETQTTGYVYSDLSVTAVPHIECILGPDKTRVQAFCVESKLVKSRAALQEEWKERYRERKDLCPSR